MMRMLDGLLEREVTRDDPEWTAAVALPTIREKMKIMPSRRQDEENERDCRKIVQQLVSSIPHGKNRGAVREEKPLPLWTRIKKVRR